MANVYPLLATLTYKNSRRLIELGLLIALIGGLGLAIGGTRARGISALGGLLLAAGLALTLIIVHFGVSPFRHR